MLRLFFAIPIPPPQVAGIGAMVDALRRCGGARVSWVRSENLHLTLRFIGDTPDDRVDSIVDAARSALEGVQAVPIEIAGGGAFPGGRKPPRVLWLGLDSGGRLEHIAHRIDEALSGIGIKRDRSPFRSHLTIGRVRSGDAAPLRDRLRETGSCGRFVAQEVVLYRSDLLPTGARYTALDRIALPHRR